MPSVIIPACNEQTVIGRCLAALLGASSLEERQALQIIIVCNGCNDQTADVARRFGDPVQVIETPIGSKVRALNLGEQAATSFPRFFIDADVVFPLRDLRKVAARLHEGKLAAAPRASFDLAGCSWPVRAFYDIHMRLPQSLEGIGGSGVYAVSAAGRARFGAFPDVVADDGYVRLHFTSDERETLIDAHSTVFAPRTLGELIRIKTRSHMGSAELKQLVPALWERKGASNGGALLMLFKQPALWPKLAVYIGVKVVARARSRRQLRRGDRTWQRDLSSRQLETSPIEAPLAASEPAGI